MLIEGYCRRGKCERWFMENLEIPKQCPTCKGTDIWWSNDEEFSQAVECELMEDEDD